MENPLGSISRMGSALLTTHSSRCACVRNRNAQCTLCAQVCTTGAIHLTAGQLDVDPERCIGCGTCATACPTCALEAVNPTDADLSRACAAAIQDGCIDMACSCSVSSPAAVVCIGRIDESLLMELALRGVSRVVLHTGDCEKCIHHTGGTLARSVISSAKSLFDTFGMHIRIILTEAPMQEGIGAVRTTVVLPQTNEPSPICEDDGDDEFTPVFEHVGKDGTLSHFTPPRHVRLHRMMSAAGAPQGASLETRLWGEVNIDTHRCQSCRMCAVFCPTGALRRISDGNGSVELSHRPALCVQCRTCESICPTHAITVASEVAVDAFLQAKSYNIELSPPTWTPNQPDSMFTRSRRHITGDNVTMF